MNKTDFKYYNYKHGILRYNFDYNFIVGGRSNGKTTGYQRDVALDNFFNKDFEQFVKIVRTEDDTIPLLNEKWIDITVQEDLKRKGYTYIYYKKTYYIGKENVYKTLGLKKFLNDDNTHIWGYVIPLSQEQRYKSSDRSKVTTIVFDEFAVSNEYLYLTNEVDRLMSLISTIIRSRDNVKVFFIGNALSLKNPYFDYFGIDATKLRSGNIYSFAQCGDEYKEYATVGLDFAEMIYTKEDDIPKLLRVSGNVQATSLDKYIIPDNIVRENDWLIIACNKNCFDEYYYINSIIAWIKEDESIKNIDDIKMDRTPKFDVILEVVYKYDDKIRYLIKNNSYEDEILDYGLYTNFNVKPFFKVGKDIRIKLPLFNSDYNYILGSTDLIDFVHEMKGV